MAFPNLPIPIRGEEFNWATFLYHLSYSSLNLFPLNIKWIKQFLDFSFFLNLNFHQVILLTCRATTWHRKRKDVDVSQVIDCEKPSKTTALLNISLGCAFKAASSVWYYQIFTGFSSRCCLILIPGYMGKQSEANKK